MNPITPLADSVALQHAQRRDHRERYLASAGKNPVATAYAAQDELILGQIQILERAASLLRRLSAAYDKAPDMPIRRVVDLILGTPAPNAETSPEQKSSKEEPS